MQPWKLVLALMLAVSFARPMMAQNKRFIDWNGLKNPVLSYPNWSVKDTAMAYRNGTFYIFFSAFYPERGQVRSHVVEVSTRDEDGQEQDDLHGHVNEERGDPAREVRYWQLKRDGLARDDVGQGSSSFSPA